MATLPSFDRASSDEDAWVVVPPGGATPATAVPKIAGKLARFGGGKKARRQVPNSRAVRERLDRAADRRYARLLASRQKGVQESVKIEAAKERREKAMALLIDSLTYKATRASANRDTIIAEVSAQPQRRAKERSAQFRREALAAFAAESAFKDEAKLNRATARRAELLVAFENRMAAANSLRSRAKNTKASQKSAQKACQEHEIRSRQAAASIRRSALDAEAAARHARAARRRRSAVENAKVSADILSAARASATKRAASEADTRRATTLAARANVADETIKIAGAAQRRMLQSTAFDEALAKDAMRRADATTRHCEILTYRSERASTFQSPGKSLERGFTPPKARSVSPDWEGEEAEQVPTYIKAATTPPRSVSPTSILHESDRRLAEAAAKRKRSLDRKAERAAISLSRGFASVEIATRQKAAEAAFNEARSKLKREAARMLRMAHLSDVQASAQRDTLRVAHAIEKRMSKQVATAVATEARHRAAEKRREQQLTETIGKVDQRLQKAAERRAESAALEFSTTA